MVAKRMAHPCGWPGCPAVVPAGVRYCPEHAKRAQREYDSDRGTAAQRGYDARWRKMRLMVLRQEPLCRECMKAGRVTPATEIHHIDGNAKNMSRENLEPLCKACHSKKTAREQHRWG
jgi:5-methylcytosine-specific restriction protein A